MLGRAIVTTGMLAMLLALTSCGGHPAPHVASHRKTRTVSAPPEPASAYQSEQLPVAQAVTDIPTLKGDTVWSFWRDGSTLVKGEWDPTYAYTSLSNGPSIEVVTVDPKTRAVLRRTDVLAAQDAVTPIHLINASGWTFVVEDAHSDYYSATYDPANQVTYNRAYGAIPPPQ